MARKMAAPLTEVHTMYDWRWFSRLSSSLCIFLFHCFVLFYCSLPFFKTSQHFCTTPPFFSPLVGGHSIYNHHWRQSVRGGGGGGGGRKRRRKGGERAREGKLEICALECKRRRRSLNCVYTQDTFSSYKMPTCHYCLSPASSSYDHQNITVLYCTVL